MKTADTDGASVGYELRSKLARRSLHAAEADPDRRLAWVNSIGLAFLLIGLVGSRPAAAHVKPLPPVEVANAVLVESLPPPPQPASAQQSPEESDNPTPTDAPRVVVVTPETPTLQFSVPTLGNLAVPNKLAQAPPWAPLKAVAPLRELPVVLNATGTRGERPQPPYPRIALDQGQQGAVTLRLSADEAGLITAIEVAHSSGFPALDRSALEYVKRHWTVPSGKGRRVFEATIIYRLQ
jgi:periplasmic protein TonB